MKTVRLSLTLIVFSLLCSTMAFSQPAPYEYKMNTPPLPIQDFTNTTSTITLDAAHANFSINDLNVMVNIRHTHAADLRIVLTAPSGLQYTLSQYNGKFGMNYENTIFDSSPGTGLPGKGIDDASNTTAFFRGIYKPQTGTTLPTSGNPVGDWTLTVYDNAVGDQGTLVMWALLFNNYGKYKDVRIGCDLNANNWVTYPVPLIGDFTTVPPYSIHSYRLEGDDAYSYVVYQNSRDGGDASLMLQHKDPSGNSIFYPEWYWTFAPNSQGAISMILPFSKMAGTHQYSISGIVRGDVNVTRNDNYYTASVPVTAGTVGYDNGDWANGNTYNPPVNECNAMWFSIFYPGTLSSVDIWEGSQVEYDSPTSTSRNEVMLWDANGVSPVQKATTGLVPMPPQGQKWVTYRFGQNGVALTAGNYMAGICVRAIDPNVGGFASVIGLGVDRAVSPFDPQSFYNKYTGFGVQLWGDGTTWSEETFRDCSTKMIRPNFVNLIDVGVTSIVSTVTPTSVTAVVTYGIYAASANPNVVARGTVTIKDANGNQVGYQEQRVFMVNQTPYMTNATATFAFNGLAKGTYTVNATIDHGSDENLINNTYSRTITIVFAPVTVVKDESMGQKKMNQIATAYADQGMSVNFVDRASFVFPAEGSVVWACEMTPAQAAEARAFAEKGNSLSFLTAPTADATNNTFAMLANPKEKDAMLARAIPANIARPQVDYSMLNTLSEGVSIYGGTPAQEAEAAKRVGGFRDYLNNMKLSQNNLNRLNNRGVVYDHSEDMRIEAKRMNDITVAEVVMNKKSETVLAASKISNPANFELTQNYPNPFNPSTIIAYNLPNNSFVSIRVYDLLGRELAVLANSSQASGKYLVSWDGKTAQGATVASGMYLYRMEATPLDGSKSFISTKKMMFAK
jgi:subtilisin-like proprotein convertase family protein